MISGQTKKLKQAMGGYKYMRNEKITSSHPQTTHLWKVGDGKLPKQEIKVSGWNINGVRAAIRKNALMPFLDDQKPDFLCLNETKAQFSNGHLLPRDYHQYWNFCKISAGYSGVLILTPHKPIGVVQDIPGEQVHSLEGRMLTLEYESFYLVNVYKPNPGKKLERLEYVLRYEAAFNKFVFHMMKKKDVIIFGDFQMAHTDYDLHNPEANVGKPGCLIEQRQPFTELIEGGFVDTYRQLYPTSKKYTYWARFYNSRQRGLGWRMDYTLASCNKLKLVEALIHDKVQGSDHCPVSTVFKIK